MGIFPPQKYFTLKKNILLLKKYFTPSWMSPRPRVEVKTITNHKLQKCLSSIWMSPRRRVKEKTITITITEQQLHRSQKCEAAVQCRQAAWSWWWWSWWWWGGGLWLWGWLICHLLHNNWLWRRWRIWEWWWVQLNTTNRKQTRPQRVPSPFHTNVKCSKKDRKVKDTRNTNTQAQRQEYAKYMRVCEVVCMDSACHHWIICALSAYSLTRCA